MDQVIDDAQAWPCTVSGITDSQVTVQMAGNNGLNAVCTGPSRVGQVDCAGNLYPVNLPGAFEGMIVTFRRV